MNDVAKTPREELECKKKYLYEYSMFWECNDGSKCQILEEDVCEKLNEQQATITKLEQICEKKMQEIENIKYSLKEIAYKYQKEVQFKADTDPNQAVKEVLCEQQATIEQLEKVNGENFAKRRLLEQHNLVLRNENRELRQQLQEYKENWDDMVELATKTSLRNVELDEQIGQLQKKIRVLSAHLLSDECALTDSQIRKIKGELDNV